ncbi:hypothetical protein LINGRAHAP2_LOCUS20784 [Linum grandiflorum]
MQDLDKTLQATSNSSAAVTRSGQSVFSSVYRTKIAGQSRLVTVTWSKNLLLHGLSISFQQHQHNQNETSNNHYCKLELKPWYFWRKQGSKRFFLDGNKPLDAFWDLKSAKFHVDTPEPSSHYYVALACDDEVVLLLGDMRNEAYHKSRCRPSLNDPVLLSRKEHVYGKKVFLTRAKFHDRGPVHDISIECRNGKPEPEMEIRMDGNLAVQVKHLRWKFRGNDSVQLTKYLKVEVYWDVHDWLFSPGLRHASFIFKPTVTMISSATSSDSSPATTTTTPLSGVSSSGSSSAAESSIVGETEFSLFLYAWRMD